MLRFNYCYTVIPVQDERRTPFIGCGKKQVSLLGVKFKIFSSGCGRLRTTAGYSRWPVI